MAFLAWDQSLETGIVSVDEQHRKLVSLINDLEQSVLDGTGGLLVSLVFQELIRYVQEHFEDEEQLMARYCFPELDQHRREHERFVNRITEIQENFRDGDALSCNVLEFLVDWLVSHIRGTDQIYAAFIRGVTGTD